MNEYHPSFLRDCAVLGACFAALLLLGARIGWQLARTRFLREGQAQGAALQRRHNGTMTITMRRDVEAGRN